jgi:hypothetical protein
MSLNANNKPVYAITPENAVGALSNGSSVVTLGSDTNGVTVFTASASGSRVYGLIASNNDTNAVGMLVYIKLSSTIIPLGIVNIPASAGNTTAAGNFDVLANLSGLPYDNTGKVYIEMAASAVLKVGNIASQTSAKTVYVSALAADYQ